MEIKSFRGYSSISDSKINEFIADKKNDRYQTYISCYV